MNDSCLSGPVTQQLTGGLGLFSAAEAADNGPDEAHHLRDGHAG